MLASEWLGRIGGVALAPLTGVGALLRRARLFHPEGVLYRARVNPLVEAGPRGALADRLSGDALVRISTAVWRGGREWIDVLGFAIRFRSSPELSVLPDPRDQDLLLATIRFPWTTPVAPLKTHFHDFLRNDYYAVSPFTVQGLGRVKFRVLTVPVRLEGRDRFERLDRAVREELAGFRLELKRQGRNAWEAVAAIRPIERVELDGEALRFSAFRSGRGIVPSGFVQNLRPAAYWASQALRPRSTAKQTHGRVVLPVRRPAPPDLHAVPHGNA